MVDKSIKDPTAAGQLDYGVGWPALAMALIHVAVEDYRICKRMGYFDPSGRWRSKTMHKIDGVWCVKWPIGDSPADDSDKGTGLASMEDVEALWAFFEPGGQLDSIIDGLASHSIKLSGNRIRREVGHGCA